MPVKEKRPKLRALTDMSLRKSADPENPKYQEWHEWPKGRVFTPPPNLNVTRALERGIAELADKAPAEEVSDGEK